MFEVMCLDEFGNSLDHLTQWDYNQTLIVSGDGLDLNNIAEVHFFNKNSKQAIATEASTSGGNLTAFIPNSLLTQPYTIYAHLWVREDWDNPNASQSGANASIDNSENSKGKSRYTIALPVKARPQPSNYVYIEDAFVIKLTSDITTFISRFNGFYENDYASTLRRISVLETDLDTLETRVSDISTNLNQKIEAVENAQNASIRNLSQKHDIWTSGKYLNTSGDTVNISTAASAQDFGYMVLECSEGEVFTVVGTGGSAARLWAFASDAGNILSKSDVSLNGEFMLTAPAGSKYLICNSNLNAQSNSAVYKLIGSDTENLILSSSTVELTSWAAPKSVIPTHEATSNISTPTAITSHNHMLIPCSEGDVFVVTGTGSSNSRLWAFLDAGEADSDTGDTICNVLSRADVSVTEDSVILQAPKNTAYLVINVLLSKPHAVYKINASKGAAALTLRADKVEETGGYMERYKNLIYGKTRASYRIPDDKRAAQNVNLHTVHTDNGTIPRNGGYAIEKGHRYLVFITADVTFTGTVPTGARFQPHVKIGDAAMAVCQTFIKRPNIRGTDRTRIEISGLYTASQDAPSANAVPCAMANGCGTDDKDITLAYDKVCLIDVTDIDYQKVLDLLRSYESDAEEFVVTQKESIEKNTADISTLNTRIGEVEPIAAEVTQLQEAVGGNTESIAELDKTIDTRIDEVKSTESVVLSGTTTKYDNWVSGYIATNGDTADINSRVASNTYKSMVIPCLEGDIFYISLLGGIIARGWAFVDSDGTVLKRSTTATDICFAKAPVGSAYLVLNHSYTLQEENPIYKITDPKSVVALTLCADNLEETGGYMKRYKNLAFGRQRTSEYSKTKTAGSSGTGIDFYCGTLTTSTGAYNAQHGLTVEADRDYLVYITFAVKSVSGYTKGTLYPRVRIGTSTTSITNKKTVNAAGLTEGSEFELYGIYHSSDLSAFIFPHMQITGIDNTIEQDITFSFEKVCFIDITGMTDSEMTELIKLIRSYETDAAEFVITQKNAIEGNTAEIDELDKRVGAVEPIRGELTQRIETIDAAENVVLGGTTTKYTNWVSGYIATNGDTADTAQVTELQPWVHMVLKCEEGDVYAVSGTGGIAPRLWAFTDANGTVLSRAEPVEKRDGYPITAPRESAYLAINTNIEVGS